MWRYAAQTMVVTSLLVLAGVLIYGVYDGSLAPGAAGERSPRSEVYGSTSGGSFGDEPDEHGIVTVSEDRRTLRSFEGASLSSGNEIGAQAEIELSSRASTIEPTPGGVSVWVTYEERPEIDVFASDTLEHEASVTPPQGQGRIPRHLRFSENGQTLFVTWQDSDQIDVYRHEMRELTHRMTVEAEGTVGPVYRNRRATRIYRATDDGKIAVFFAQNGQRLGEVDSGSSRAGEAALLFSDDRLLLWGVTEAGHAFAVDEAQTSVGVSGISVSPSHAPVAAHSREPGLDGDGRAVFVDEDESALVRVSVSDLDSGTSAAGGQFVLSEFDEISGERIVRAVTSGTGTIVLFTDGGEIVELDREDLSLRAVTRTAQAASGSRTDADEASTGEGDLERPAAPARDISLTASYSIRRDGNFACF